MSLEKNFKKLVKEKMNDNDLMRKVTDLTIALKHSECAVVYTGAGISTNASIPDYRGKNGVYTATKKGAKHPGCPDLTEVNPTYAHCVLRDMLYDGVIKHIVSQNCDGLHLRTGIPQDLISEIHGNSYVEWCQTCPKQYVRNEEITHKGDKSTHMTGSTCSECNDSLYDTIIYCNETRYFRYPQNWERITNLLDDVDLIIVLGSSCRVLAAYDTLFPPSAKIILINVGGTSLDADADLKISEDCDVVLYLAATKLGLSRVADYCRKCDPVINADKNPSITEWSVCMCQRRTSRNFADECCKQSASRLDYNKLPGWMTVVPPASPKRSYKKRKAQTPVKNDVTPKKAMQSQDAVCDAIHKTDNDLSSTLLPKPDLVQSSESPTQEHHPVVTEAPVTSAEDFENSVPEQKAKPICSETSHNTSLVTEKAEPNN